MELQNYVTGIQHIGLPTNSMEKTLEFYTGLGFEVAYQTVSPSGNKVAFLTLKNLTIETFENHAAPGVSGAINHVCLDVTDVDAAFKAAKEKNYDIKEDEVKSLPFWENGVRFFNIVGPNSETVEFCQKL